MHPHERYVARFGQAVHRTVPERDRHVFPPVAETVEAEHPGLVEASVLATQRERDLTSDGGGCDW